MSEWLTRQLCNLLPFQLMHVLNTAMHHPLTHGLATQQRPWWGMFLGSHNIISFALATSIFLARTDIRGWMTFVAC